MSILKDAVRDHGEVTDDDRRRAAERSGLPEATVYGISSFYDDLTEPRGRRHVAACNGTACWAAHAGDYVEELGERLGLAPGVFTAFHFPEVRANLLVGQSSDVNTSCPEYKVVAVAVE